VFIEVARAMKNTSSGHLARPMAKSMNDEWQAFSEPELLAPSTTRDDPVFWRGL
jgi:hypothetical protein